VLSSFIQRLAGTEDPTSAKPAHFRMH